MASKRITRKLTDKVREKIKKDYAKLKKSDYADEALVYLNRVKGAAKGRKTKKGKVAKIEKLVIPPNSEMYALIQRAAKSQKMTVAAFVKKNREAIIALMKDGDNVMNRETDRLIDDVKAVKKNGGTVFVNDGNGFFKTPALKDIFNIQTFIQAVHTTDIFMVFFRVHSKLNGDLTHFLPPPEEYEDLEGNEEFMYMLDTYYPEITYLISPSKTNADATPKAPKRIERPSKKVATKKKTSKKK